MKNINCFIHRIFMKYTWQSKEFYKKREVFNLSLKLIQPLSCKRLLLNLTIVIVGKLSLLI